MKKAMNERMVEWLKHNPEIEAQLRAVAAMPDEEIDLTDPDCPEITDFSGFARRSFYKPIKAQKTLRLDADVLAHFQSQGRGYQTRINDVLRRAMLEERAATRPDPTAKLRKKQPA